MPLDRIRMILSMGALNFNFSKSYSSFGIAPFGRYYFEGEKSTRLFMQARVGYFSSKFDSFGDDERSVAHRSDLDLVLPSF